MNRTGFAILKFNAKYNDLGDGKELCYGLSAVVQIGNTLWVTNDETTNLERLSLMQRDISGNYWYEEHQQFSLADYLDLPVPPISNREKDDMEADVESLAYENGYLWLVGSHSRKRKKTKKEKSVQENRERLAEVTVDGNRFLIARIPIAEEAGRYKLKKEMEQHGMKYTAARLHGDDKGSDLTDALSQDQHLQPFLTIPCKDNGLDIEGLAVVNGRLLLGLRGPVLRGWAVILELELKEDNDNPSTLRLKKIGRDNRPYRKHLLELDGLGIRDLCVHGPDLLILAGPTMDLDGPVAIFRWPGGAQPKEEESLIPAKQLERIMNIPYGQGVDHAEGLTLFSPNGAQPRSLLVVYDSSSEERRMEEKTTKADIFVLPQRQE
jgi:hypothetical protein